MARGRIGVLALVPDRWSPQFESRHQVLSRLAEHFDVVWVEPSHGWRSTLAVLRRDRRLAPAPPPRLHVRRPSVWLPRFHRTPWLDRATRTAHLRRAADRLRSRGCAAIVLYIWRPEFRYALDEVESDFCVYHVDDEYSFSDAIGMADGEAELLARADRVIVHSPRLMERKSGLNPHMTLVPNGVDFDAFASPRPRPVDLDLSPAPVIGYAGYSKRQLDWALIEALVQAQPRWSFVFVGGTAPHPEVPAIIERLASHHNVRFLGAKPSDELSAYPQHFDCCIMPYQRTEYNDCIYPMKLHEYLASGRPVVATPIRSVVPFGGAVSLATTLDEWSAAIAQALTPSANGGAARCERQAIARQYDWRTLTRTIAAIIASGLGETLDGAADGLGDHPDLQPVGVARAHARQRL